MRKYEIDEVVETLRTLPSEIFLNDFIKTVSIDQFNLDPTYEYYLDAFEIFGLSKDYLDIIDTKTLVDTIKDFQADFIIDNKLTKSIEIDGFTYTAYADEFVINARDFAKIEKRINHKDHTWLAFAMAVIFKRDDLSSVEHKDNAHIEYKKKLFTNKLTMDICLPYIMKISETYVDNIKILSNIK